MTGRTSSPPPLGRPRHAAWSLLLAVLLGTLLTALFWPKLWQGGGFIGGDTYTYFLPQKAFFADRLKAGEFPLWNSLVGHGYPLIGESQTAAFYPLNPPLYRWLDLNTAYVASHLLHYVLAFLGCWLLATRLELGPWGAALAATVYVYGWFPPRVCLEWAIIGGAYLPWALWCVESYFQTGRLRYAAGLSLTFTLDLLAGHYNLAFITTLVVGGYLPARWWLARRRMTNDTASRPVRDAADTAPHDERISSSFVIRHSSLATPGVLLAAVVLGYGLAGPQLVPSWDLLRSSQRTEANEEFDPGYGHIPPWYLSQAATPWLWFARDANPDASLNSLKWGTIPSLTNKVEAHLYFGLAPLVLAMGHLAIGWWTGRPVDSRLRCLWWLGLLAAVYATGWLLPVARHLPGFGYFRGPGRYGIVTTLAVALLAGNALSQWVRNRPSTGWMVAAVLLALTIVDLRRVAGNQGYAYVVSEPAIEARDESVVRRFLREQPGVPRMLAPGANLATLTGFAAAPPYLGFGPDAYYLDGGRLPDRRFLQFLSGDATPEGVDVAAQFAWLRDAGVTHLLSMNPLPSGWPVRRVWEGFDPLLNPSWARWQEPLFLYAVEEPRGRAWIEGGATDDQVSVRTYEANRVVVETQTAREATLVLSDLPWHEWEVRLDDQIVASSEADATGAADRVQRRVELPAGRHVVEWTYRPRSLWWGCALSAASALCLAPGAAFVRRRQQTQSRERRRA